MLGLLFIACIAILVFSFAIVPALWHGLSSLITGGFQILRFILRFGIIFLVPVALIGMAVIILMIIF